MSNKLTNKVFCILPFVKTVVRANRSINPCCLINSFKYQDIDSYWNSPELANMRTRMLVGQEKLSECNICYTHEEKFGTSERIGFLQHFQIDSENYVEQMESRGYLDAKFPKRLELHLGNLCNLKCLTCSPRDSSSLLVENNLLNISNLSPNDFQLSDDLIEKSLSIAFEHGVDVLDLRGGESMLMPKVKQILSELPLTHKVKSLRIQTNGTILDDEWKEIFSKFESLEIMISIDSFGSANHYIRYPADWDQIERTVDYVLSLEHANKYVNTTVSNLNFLLLAPLIDWCKKKGIYFHYSPLNRPVEFHYTNLPNELFTLGCDRLKNYPEVKNLLDQLPNSSHWQDFCSIITKRDNHRKNSIFDILPEYKPFWINS